MKKRYLLLILLIPLLSGCYNYRELNKLGIATSFSIDYKDNNFIVMVEVINPTKQQDAAANNSPIIVFTRNAPTLKEAFRNIILESPRNIYSSHAEMIILSAEVINNHLGEVLEYFSRDTETRTEVNIMLAKTDNSINVISLQTLLNSFSSSNIMESLETQSKINGVTYSVTLNDLINMYLDPYLEIKMPTILLNGNTNIGDEKENIETSTPKAIAEINGTAIFKDDKVLDILDINNSKILSIINGNLSQTVLSYIYKNNYIVFEPNRIKTSKKVDVKNNKVTIEIEGFAKINSFDAIADIRNYKEIDKIQKFLNTMIENDVLNLFNNIRDNYNTDVFGFRQLYYKTDTNFFKNNMTNWYEDIFPNLDLEVKSNIKLYEKGNTLGGIQYERQNY